MKRRFDELRRGGGFDLVVVGGSLHGAWVAWDAVLRGMSVAVVEADDWGAGGPPPHGPLVHGSLAELERGHLRRVRRRLAERRTLWRIGPHRVRPLPLLLPVYGDSSAARTRTRAILWLYDRLAGLRRPVGPPEHLASVACRRRFRFLERGGLAGGFLVGECGADDQRLAVELIDGAAERGAVVVNRARALELLREGGQVSGVRVVDEDPVAEDDEAESPAAEIDARAVVVCGTSPAAALLGEGDAPPPRARATYAVLPALPLEQGLVVSGTAPDDVVLALPWYGRSLLFASRPGEDLGVERLIARANRALSKIRWTAAHVISTFEVPQAIVAGGSADGRSLLDRRTDGCIVLRGGGLTWARLDARRAVDAAGRITGHRGGCRTAETGLPWSPDDYLDWRRDALVRGLNLGLDEATAEGARRRYGARVERLYGLIEKLPRLARRFLPEHPLCYGDLVMAGLHEMARGLDDVLLRRVPLARIERLSPEAVAHAAEIVGAVLGWSDGRREREIAALRPGGRRRRGAGSAAATKSLDGSDESS